MLWCACVNLIHVLMYLQPTLSPLIPGPGDPLCPLGPSRPRSPCRTKEESSAPERGVHWITRIVPSFTENVHLGNTCSSLWCAKKKGFDDKLNQDKHMLLSLRQIYLCKFIFKITSNLGFGVDQGNIKTFCVF